jgi:hypothetical protein
MGMYRQTCIIRVTVRGTCGEPFLISTGGRKNMVVQTCEVGAISISLKGTATKLIFCGM